MKVNLSCAPWGFSGYSVHSRNLALALIEEGVDLGIEPFMYPENWKSQTPPKMLEAIEKANQYGKNVMIHLPPYWQIKSGDRVPFYGFCVFEGSNLPYGWAKLINKEFVTGVLVPSEHTKQACLKSGVTRPIHVIPHGYNPKVFNTNQPPLVLEEDEKDKFTFLYVGGYKDGERDRKGLDILCRAYCAEFKKGEKVIVRAKINTAYCPPDQTFAALASLKLPPKDTREMIQTIIHNSELKPHTDEQMAQLYASADVFVSPSKAEAFNMPCLESLACGTPVIATNYGGQTGYVNNENGWLLDIEGMEPATGEPYLYEDVQWARPSQKHLQELMRYCFDNPTEIKKKKARAAESVKHLTWAESVKKLIKVLEGG